MKGCAHEDLPKLLRLSKHWTGEGGGKRAGRRETETEVDSEIRVGWIHVSSS